MLDWLTDHIDFRVKHLADHYGLDHQLDKLKEECGELREAIDIHFFAHTPQSKWALLCEIADVIFVALQCLYKLATPMKTIDAIIEFKYRRQVERIKDGVER